MTITIDPEFSALCPPSTAEEIELLEQSLKTEGCRDPLMLWLPHETAWCTHCEADVSLDYRWDHHPYGQEGDDREAFWICLQCQTPIDADDLSPLLLDGHTRFRLCDKLGLSFAVRYQWQITSREAAINWIIAHQLGRRNLTLEQKSYLRGKRFNVEKRQGTRTDRTFDHNDVKLPTAARLAKEYRVGEATIQRDGAFAQSVDTLEEHVRQDIRNAVLQRQDRVHGAMTKQQATRAGKLVQDAKVLPQPFMQQEHWKPYHVLEAIERLAALPQDEHAAVNRLLDGPFIPADDGLDILKNLTVMPSEKRQHVYTLHSHPEKRERDMALALAAAKALPPDPQSQLARALFLALEQAQQRLRRNWINVHPHEAWSDALRDLEADLLSMLRRLTVIETQIDAAHQERMAHYGTAI